MKKFRFSYDAPNGTRVNVVDAGRPDELVLKGRKGVVLLHLEQLDRDYWFLQVGDANISIHQRRDGSVHVGVRRGDFGPAIGWTESYEAGAEQFHHQHSGGGEAEEEGEEEAMNATAPMPRFVGGESLRATCEESNGTYFTSGKRQLRPGQHCDQAAVAIHAGKSLCFAHLARAGGSIPKCGVGCLCRSPTAPSGPITEI